MTILDLRYTDIRALKPPNPFWLKSAEITIAGVGKENVLFSFPASKGLLTLVYDAVFHLVTAFNGTPTVLEFGIGTILTDAVTTAGAISAVDADEIIKTADITVGTPAWYWPATSDALGFWADGSPLVITHADADTPIIYGDYAATNPTTASGFLYLLVSTIYS